MSEAAHPKTITLGGHHAAYLARLLREVERFLAPSSYTGTTPFRALYYPVLLARIWGSSAELDPFPRLALPYSR
ncbi:hypothetical protein ACWDZ8_27680 [Streptomyces sp. NPDC003233]